MQPASSNFSFLAQHDSLLARLGGLAELYSVSDPNTALFKLRQFGEGLLQQVAARAGITDDMDSSQLALIRELAGQGVLPREVADLFHVLRQAGNQAAHGFAGNSSDVIHQLKVARELGVWFHRTFGDRDSHRVRSRTRGRQSIPRRSSRRSLRSYAPTVSASGGSWRKRGSRRRSRRSCVVRQNVASYRRRGSGGALSMAGEMEELLAAERARLQAEDVEMAALRERARAAAGLMELDKKGTRDLVDHKLRDAGWEVDTEALRYSAGARPASGRSIAIAEWPTPTGPAAHVLFAGLTPIAVVEAKRAAVNVAGALEQAAALQSRLHRHGG